MPDPDSSNTPPFTPSGSLPDISSPLSGVEIVAKLDAAARRGKLPGFHKADAPLLFQMTDFGTPFESILEARAEPVAGGSRLIFAARLKPTMPWIFVIVTILSIWPGVWLTDSMLRTYSDWYNSLPSWATYAWYLPISIIPTPFVLMQAFRKSRATAHEEALKLIASISALVSTAP